MFTGECFQGCIILCVFVVLQSITFPLSDMRLKYQDEIDKFSPCFVDCEEPVNKNAFRFVFEDLTDVRNFSPVYLNDEKRLINDQKSGKDSYKGWALSFYETQAQAKTSLLHLADGKPQIFKKLGTHIAVGVLVQADGLSERKSDEYGHFNHFEYEKTDFTPRFVIVEKVAS